LCLSLPNLYVFCANASDGIETAHPTHKGQKLSDIKDANGFAFGEEIMNATEGKISEVTYMWPRPGSDTPIEKVTCVTKIGDQICAVGYYK
jgi:signal transduction histidine kinase